MLEPFRRNLFVRFHAFQHLFPVGRGVRVGVCRGDPLDVAAIDSVHAGAGVSVRRAD